MILVNANADKTDAAHPPSVEVDDPTLQNATDETQLAAAFASGNLAAVETVFMIFGPRLERLAGRILGWRNDVEDVVQEVFIAALRARTKFRGESSLETWLVRIAINTCRAYQRKQWVREKWFRKKTESVAPSAIEVDATTLKPDANAMVREEAETVQRAIAELPSKLREVVVLYYLESKSAQEIADILKTKVNTINARLSRARKQLTKILS